MLLFLEEFLLILKMDPLILKNTLLVLSSKFKWNLTPLATRRVVTCCRLVVSVKAQTGLGSLPSSPSAQYSVSWRPLSLFSLWIILLPPSSSPLFFPVINHCDGYLVPLAWWLMAGKGQVYQLWGHNSVYGLAMLNQSGCPWTSWAPTSTKQRKCSLFNLGHCFHNTLMTVKSMKKEGEVSTQKYSLIIIIIIIICFEPEVTLNVITAWETCSCAFVQ